MKYLLNENIALRSWWRVPYAYYVRHQRDARGLTQAQFEVLRRCDGKQDLEPCEQLDELVALGFAQPCKEGALSDWQKHRECDNRYFPALSLMLTGKCNYNCLHCFNAADNAPLMSEFQREELIRLLDDAQKCGINAFTITGGEPKLSRYFFDAVEGIYARGMYVQEINTNGYYINEQTLARLKAADQDIKLKISFDGIGHHDWMRNRKGAEENALNAIRMCKEAGFCVQAQTNVHRLNLDTLLQTAELMEELGCEHMRIIRTTEAPRWVENAGDSCLTVDEYYDEMLKFVEAFTKKPRKMEVDIWQFVYLFCASRRWGARPVACSRLRKYRETLPVCSGNRAMVAVAANGNVYPCHQVSGYYEKHNYYLGNVKKDGLQPLLQVGKYIAEVCTPVSSVKEHDQRCGSCRYFRYCLGGCRAIATAFTGDKLAHDPAKCAFFYGGYYEKLRNILSEWEDIEPIGP